MASEGQSGKPFVIGIVGVIGVLTAISIGLIWSRRVPAYAGMVYYESGNFLAGPDKKLTKVSAYFLDEAEVSVGEYAEFCKATGCAAPQGPADVPVTGITIGQARGYAQWKGKRLPNALEWERAARGLDGGRYPWGDTEDPALANVRDNPMLTEHKSMPVRSYRRQQGIFNAAGNAAEFVDEASGPQVRGGSYETALGDIRPYEYKSVSETFLAPDVGFRCARNGK